MNVSGIASTLASPVRPADAAGSVREKGAAPDEAGQRRKVAGQFEAILVRQMLSKSVGSMLGGNDDVAGSIYGDMMTDVLAQNLTSGQGLGLGRMLEKQLAPRAPAAAATPPSTHSSKP
ncbi:MAG: hypothetical protein JWM32_1567 [Verrucomicrobia bacterium]|nr:hypothetical protein [Verrucomicrobiota bacterium]